MGSLTEWLFPHDTAPTLRSWRQRLGKGKGWIDKNNTFRSYHRRNGAEICKFNVHRIATIRMRP